MSSLYIHCLHIGQGFSIFIWNLGIRLYGEHKRVCYRSFESLRDPLEVVVRQTLTRLHANKFRNIFEKNISVYLMTIDHYRSAIRFIVPQIFHRVLLCSRGNVIDS